VQRLGRESAHYAFDCSLPPALEVAPGESFWVETNDAHRGTITDETVVYASLEDAVARVGGVNPVAGPIAVRGAGRGDCLLVTIEEIVPAPRRRAGYTCSTPRVHPDVAAETVICPIDGEDVLLRTAAGLTRLPLRPMIGTLGVAPAGEPRPSFGQGTDILGNVDLPALTTGATAVIAAHVDQGLLFVGDAHLVQGDAEIHRAAIEAEADVRLTVRLATADEAGFTGLPQINTADSWGSVATGPGQLDDLVRHAYDDLALRLVRGSQLTLADAYRLLGAAGRITVGQVVPPLSSVLAWLPTHYLPTTETTSASTR
jgi:acetamidase/formamidase